MKTEIEITNGSGWNNYKGLQELKRLPVGTKSLMAKNKVARLEVRPYDCEKPLGIGVFYFDSDGDKMYCQVFDQNDTAKWICGRITALLNQGIDNRIAEVRRRVAAEALAEARSAGFETAFDHRKFIAEKKEKEAAQAKSERESILNDTSNAAAAESELKNLLVAHKNAVRLSRKCELIFKTGGTAIGDVELNSGIFLSNRNGMIAWLFQHGQTPSIDKRNYFFDYCKPEKQ